jgi:hypothetical protein
MRAFEQLGFDVTMVDLSRFVEGGGRYLNHLRMKLALGPGIAALNRSVLSLSAQLKPNIVWVDKGLYLWPMTLRAVKQCSNALLVHLEPDDPFRNPLGRRLFFKAIPEYDVHVVARDVNIPEFRRAGARHVVRYHWGFDPAVHRPMSVTEAIRRERGGQVGFIGDWELERAKLINALARHSIGIRVWGPRWEYKMTDPHPNVKIEAACLVGDDYAAAINSFDINLGFLRKLNRDMSTTRSVEIPACGGFLLAERTSEHLSLFKEGVEAEFFSSEKELIEKTNYYLENASERLAIARAGHLRAVTSGYSHVDRQAAILNEIGSIVGRELLPSELSHDRALE